MYSLDLSPDGTLLASVGPDRTVKLWDTTGWKLLRSLPHADELMAVAFSPDGKLLAAGGYDKTITIWGIPQQ
jgi:WD40 repeat protein